MENSKRVDRVLLYLRKTVIKKLITFNKVLLALSLIFAIKEYYILFTLTIAFFIYILIDEKLFFVRKMLDQKISFSFDLYFENILSLEVVSPFLFGEKTVSSEERNCIINNILSTNVSKIMKISQVTFFISGNSIYINNQQSLEREISHDIVISDSISGFSSSCTIRIVLTNGVFKIRLGRLERKGNEESNAGGKHKAWITLVEYPIIDIINIRGLSFDLLNLDHRNKTLMAEYSEMYSEKSPFEMKRAYFSKNEEIRKNQGIGWDGISRYCKLTIAERDYDYSSLRYIKRYEDNN